MREPRPFDMSVDSTDLNNTIICECGVYIHYEVARVNQYDSNKRKQDTSCPVCGAAIERG